ncbi:hypothetical protein Nepgr_032557 [Nepenthes gracilis]|uniref:HTH myb-type domain-containing protein n=1 Tax=Nepenthes gracilis TaxID=150966 RepID=A0AAD3TK78_NEPGR|nr:hypothetical protein Nepgr_032557 [Nepenthes gracilis]
MTASPSDLTLDCRPQGDSMLLESFREQPKPKTQTMEEYVARLEEELHKIDAFKRELPLCIQLLTNAMEFSRQQLQSYKENQGTRPVLEEFIPLKHSKSEGSDQQPLLSNSSEKANWMTSAQLWSPASDGNMQNTCPKEADISFSIGPELGLYTQRRSGRAFQPFTKEGNVGPSPVIQALPGSVMASIDCRRESEDKQCSEIAENGVNGSRGEISGKGTNIVVGGKAVDTQITTTFSTANAQAATNSVSPTQAHRKARRCWSPDLHRRFVNALQMLGGSQAATPKQIRELMKVEGLTNDEVKSHLQKYRLHTRRPSPRPQAGVAAAPQLVVLGGIWVPTEYADAAATAHVGTPAIYSPHPSSQLPPHYYPQPVPQEFYPPAPLHQPLLHQHHPAVHHQLHVYQTSSQAHSSPEANAGGTGDRSESMEDGKSHSSSWKVDSGDQKIERERNWPSLEMVMRRATEVI